MNARAITFFVLSLFAAMLLGAMAITDSPLALGIAGGLLVLAILITLGKNVWLLIPLTMFMGGGLPFIPGNFLIHQLAIILAIGWSIILLAVRRLPWRLHIGFYEIIVGIFLLTVIQVYLRNPVGLNVLGGDTVGARPYFNVLMSAMCFFLLANLKVDNSQLFLARKLSLIGGWTEFFISLIGALSASVGSVMGRFYSSFAGKYLQELGAAGQTDVVDGSADRKAWAVQGSKIGALQIASLRDPMDVISMKILKHPRLILVLIFAFIICFFSLYSGFRSQFAFVAMMIFLGLFYWGGKKSIFKAILLAVLFYGLLNLINILHPLPANIQRSLTFLPGTWEQRYIDDAKNSSEWRFEMWEEVLWTDTWIDNKIFGDGLGLKKSELEASANPNVKDYSGWDAGRMGFLLSGCYHSGPVTFVRTTGWVGLGVYVICIFLLALKAHRIILLYKNTEYFSVVLFFGIPIIVSPLVFIFLYGDFLNDAGKFLFHCSLLALIERNIPKLSQCKKTSPERN